MFWFLSWDCFFFHSIIFVSWRCRTTWTTYLGQSNFFNNFFFRSLLLDVLTVINVILKSFSGDNIQSLYHKDVACSKKKSCVALVTLLFIQTTSDIYSCSLLCEHRSGLLKSVHTTLNINIWNSVWTSELSGLTTLDTGRYGLMWTSDLPRFT